METHISYIEILDLPPSMSNRHQPCSDTHPHTVTDAVQVWSVKGWPTLSTLAPHADTRHPPGNAKGHWWRWAINFRQILPFALLAYAADFGQAHSQLFDVEPFPIPSTSNVRSTRFNPLPLTALLAVATTFDYNPSKGKSALVNPSLPGTYPGIAA